MRRFGGKALAAAVISVLGASWPAHARWATQELILNPGWNAVFFEVQPDPNRTESVFRDVPVKSVWAWNERFAFVQYVRDPSTLLPEQPEWLTYYPAGSTNAFLSNLFAIQGGKAYLIELDGDQPVTPTFAGELILRKPEWLSDSFNLVGFHLDPAKTSTFGEFFGPSPAHDGKAMYRLNEGGRVGAGRGSYLRGDESRNSLLGVLRGPIELRGAA